MIIKKKVVVIDDDEGILEGFSAMLESQGYDTLVSGNSDFLFTLQKKDLPHIILLDVLLSGQDGRLICQKLKLQSRTKHIPVIMVSAHPQTEKIVIEAGADDFLAKPFEMDELFSKISKYL